MYKLKDLFITLVTHNPQTGNVINVSLRDIKASFYSKSNLINNILLGNIPPEMRNEITRKSSHNSTRI